MAASRRSLQLTEAYRVRLVALSDRLESEARTRWPRIEGFDTTDWPEAMAALLARTQKEGVRLTAGYVAAYLRSEGAPGRVPAIDARRYVGLSRDGRPLAEALASPLIGVRAALKKGKTPDEALAIGLARGTRMVAFEAVQTPRDALLDAIEEDPRIGGFERSVAGTCAACMALSGEPRAEVHPGCQCVPQPKVAGATNRFPLPSGASLFAALSKAEQEEKIGAEAAQLVRDGEADLKDFVAHSKQSEQDDFITQRPVSDVAT